MGEAVLTTRKPEKGREVSVDDVVALLRSGQSVMVVFGLGPKGAPKEVFAMCRRHMDITAGGFSLETCTAMGAVAGVIAHKLRA